MSLTMKELLARATPGVRVHIYGERIVWTRLNDGCRGTPVLYREGTHSTNEQADLALAARCNPVTMALVLEALERASNVGEIRFRTCALSRGASDSITAALAALNGEQTP